jgi:hypothetical protein
MESLGGDLFENLLEIFLSVHNWRDIFMAHFKIFFISFLMIFCHFNSSFFHSSYNSSSSSLKPPAYFWFCCLFYFRLFFFTKYSNFLSFSSSLEIRFYENYGKLSSSHLSCCLILQWLIYLNIHHNHCHDKWMKNLLRKLSRGKVFVLNDLRFWK